MSVRDELSFRNSWFAVSVGLTLVIFVLTALVGLVLLPYAQPNLKFANLWDAICSAAGVPRASPEAAAVAPAFKLSDVVLTSTTFAHPSQESIGRGATLAQQCAICHGPTGVSRADSPNLAGQYAGVVYKELMDFKTGARSNAVMTPFAANLNDRDMRDLAAYYAYLPRASDSPPVSGAPPEIVTSGAPMRGIAFCGACHGEVGRKAGAPWLEGQPFVYLHAQLQAFASGARHNDVGEQMRNVARRMTPAEIDAASRFYAARP